MNLSIEDLLSIPFVEKHGLDELGLAKTVREVSTDSRTVKRGDLFVALKGEKFDGHEYLDQVAQEGALAAIVDKNWLKTAKKKPAMPLLVVENTLDAYGELAHHYRKKFKIPILVIAGSNGKTTTKELVAHVLGSTRGVLKTEANYNNQIGLPRMLLQLRDGHDMAVLEIGTNHPGEIEWLTRKAAPTHVLITNIGREHLEFFKDVKGVAQEEKAAFDIVNELGGFAFINFEDKHLRPAKKVFGDRCLSFGLEQPDADVSSLRLGYTKDGRLEMRVAAEGKSFKLRTHIIADYAPNMIAGAVAVGLHFRMRRAEIKAAIEHFKPSDKRLEVLRPFMGPVILNDTYNANPDSVEAACRTLAQYPVTGKRYVILGDMFELGDTSQKEHRALGKKIAEFNFEKVFFTGKDMQLACKSYLQAVGATNGSAVERAEYIDNKEAIAESLRAQLQEGDAVLVKGSRGMKMEDVIDLLQRP